MAANVFYFGDSERRLFGVYHAAAGRGRRGIVLCNPWGGEYLHAHQTLRVLAQRLAEAGQHVLRFDWYGSGDSAGECTEATPPGSWAEDLGWAIDELKDIANVRTVSLIGLRLGAAAAALVAPTRQDVKALVLWEPVLEGGPYLDELTDDRASSLAFEDTVDARGFCLTGAMREAMATVTPDLIGSRQPPTLLLCGSHDPSRHDRIRQRLAEAGVEWADEQYDGPSIWIEEQFGSSGIPVAALKKVTEWLP